MKNHIEEYLMEWVNIHDIKQIEFFISILLKILHRKILEQVNVSVVILFSIIFLENFLNL